MVFSPAFPRVIGPVFDRGFGKVFVPSDIANLDAWWDADAIAGLSDGDAVSSWSDLSGNSRTLSEGTNPPVYKTNILNGNPVVRFVTNDKLSTASYVPVTGTADATICFVGCQTGGAQYEPSWSWGENADAKTFEHFFRYDNEGPAIDIRNSYGRYNGGVTTSFRVCTILRESISTLSTVKHRYNGSEITEIITGPDATVNTGSTVPFRVGTNRAGTVTLDGDMAEILIYTRALSASELSQVESYLASKWGITLS